MPGDRGESSSRETPARKRSGADLRLRSLAGFAVIVAAAVAAFPVAAYDVVGYTAAANNRFSSGFPTAPVTNTSGSFVGLAYSWLGVGWATSDPTKGFGFLTPKHYLVAKHYGGAATINLLAAGGQVITGTEASVTDTGYGFTNGGTQPADIAIGELTASLPAAYGLPRYGVFDANTSSTTNSSYAGQPLMVYGRGPDGTQSPRMGPATVGGAYAWNVSGSSSYIGSTVATGTLQVGDSGSPTFITWTNPNGAAEITIIGNNAATDFTSVNIYNFLGAAAVMNAVDALTTPDGYALKIVGTPSNTWVGSSSTSIGNRGAWGLSPPTPVPSDKYVLFSGTSAGNSRAVSVDTNANLRGLYFKSTGSGTLGFTFSGTSTLTIGRGGVTNYDSSPQTILSAITLGASQYWNVGSGGVTAAAVNTGTAGYLLEIDGSGTARFTGTISGAGGLALTGQRLELTGSNSYTGGTWVHNGTLSAAAGSLASTGTIAVEAGVLSAVNYNPSAPLTVSASGSAVISGTGLSLSAVSNANPSSSAVNFSAASGTITLASLAGVGATRFGSHAAITGGVSAGSVTVVQGLTAAISGGTVSAGSLTSGTVSGGVTAVVGSAAITRVSGGVTTIGGAATIGTLASGTIALSGSGSTISSLAGGRLAIDGGMVSVASGTFGGTITGTGGILVKAGGGVLSLTSSNGFAGSTSVQGGRLSLAHATALGASSVSVLPGGTLAVAPYLDTTVGGLDPNAGGLVDVGTGGMTVTAGLSTPSLISALLAGRNDGLWNGTSGITSSAVAADVAVGQERAIGWLDNGDGSVFFAYAAPGDTNLDGLVDVLDGANFEAAGKYDTNLPASWFQGDFNYDGIVDVLDAAFFVTTGLFNQGYYNQPPLAFGTGLGGLTAPVVAVPEPTGLAAAGLAGIMVLAAVRRRR